MKAKSKRGGRRPGAGRKPKVKEQELIEKLTPYENQAIKKLSEAIEQGAPWAIKLFMEYRYGKPIQRVESQHEFKDSQAVTMEDVLRAKTKKGA